MKTIIIFLIVITQCFVIMFDVKFELACRLFSGHSQQRFASLEVGQNLVEA